MWHVSLSRTGTNRSWVTSPEHATRWQHLRAALGWPVRPAVPFAERVYVLYALPIPLIGRDLHIWRPMRPGERRLA